MPPVGFEPTISAGERPQTYALDSTATGIGLMLVKLKYKIPRKYVLYQSCYAMRTDGRPYIATLTRALTKCFSGASKHCLRQSGLELRMFSNQKLFFFRCRSTNRNICAPIDKIWTTPGSNLDPEACLRTVPPKYLGSHHLIIGHNRFLPYPFPFIIHSHSYHVIQRYVTNTVENVSLNIPRISRILLVFP